MDISPPCDVLVSGNDDSNHSVLHPKWPSESADHPLPINTCAASAAPFGKKYISILKY